MTSVEYQRFIQGRHADKVTSLPCVVPGDFAHSAATPWYPHGTLSKLEFGAMLTELFER